LFSILSARIREVIPEKERTRGRIRRWSEHVEIFHQDAHTHRRAQKETSPSQVMLRSSVSFNPPKYENRRSLADSATGVTPSDYGGGRDQREGVKDANHS